MGKRQIFPFIGLIGAFLLAACGGPPAPPSGPATLLGTVVDATSAEPVEGARVCVAGGHCTLSDADGGYRLVGLPKGRVEIRVEKSGYQAETRAMTLVAGENRADFALSPELAEGGWRVVLTWNAKPEDLDARLWTPDGTEVYFENKGNCEARPWACLDVDDSDGEGPETITLTRLEGGEGVYSYAVVWYRGEGSWASSGAVVRVYDENGRVASFSAPRNDQEPAASSKIVWYVFDLDAQGHLTPINRLQATLPR